MKRDAEFFRRTFADKAGEWARRQFEIKFDFLRARCESPIEEAMLAALIYVFDSETEHRLGDSGGGRFTRQQFNWPENASREKSLHPYNGVRIYQQAQVGDYRVDFLVEITNWDGDTGPKLPQDRATVLVVECDGHDFHERTKEQAERDRSRDRWMTANGITVIRFTGSEIWRDPTSCAEEVEGMVVQLQGEF